VPGDDDGGVNFDPIFDALKNGGFHGWIVVEAEQDPAKADPVRYATIARNFIATKLHL
jgi:inosose dehydratase